MSDPALLESACRALAALVREEYPASYSLAEIAYTWGNMDDSWVDALRIVEESGLFAEQNSTAVAQR